ncbi:hypothetical protein J4Q44_G00008360 [Coregonus suidteri]|uniref:DNA-directed DNA polymerase X domain-containing protein n=1 Tax=Coregonus suidteri TaxID=861788 RepID=A0AAN8MF06_9TELE
MDVMEELAESSEFNESKGPCLAFRQAASVLKSLPSAVRCLGAIQGLPWLGEHTKAVMEEILTFGRSFKVEEIRCDERYQALKLFTSVFGVGPKTAEKWYRRGLRSLKEILTEPNIQLNRMQRAGFLYYSDISKAVSKAEAEALGCIIEETVHWIAPDAVLALTGGFRRGKEYGHDVDFLLTVPEMGKEEGLLLHVIDRLRDQGILLYCDHQGSTFDVSKLPSCRFEDMDHFQKCFLILRLEEGQVEGERGLQRDPGDSRGWRAVRVDLVAPPVDRYAFALLGWTGSKQFGRDLRTFARKERQMLLDNHALYDKTKRNYSYRRLLRRTSLPIWVWSMWSLGREMHKHLPLTDTDTIPTLYIQYIKGSQTPSLGNTFCHEVERRFCRFIKANFLQFYTFWHVLFNI